MKVKVTRKEVKENFTNVLCISYCNLQYLLYYRSADYYSTRAEGWACDYYVINNDVIISTGYAPIGQKIDYKIVRKYDLKAQKIIYSDFKFETKKRKLDTLLNQFINEVLQQ